ncbi:TPA: hypothetical protein ACGZ5C_002200 [Citrobacter freundii]
MTWLDGVRGMPPTKIGTWACLFARRGGKIFAAPPGLLNSLWANVRRWVRWLKISNFCEIEFSVRAPHAYLRLNNFSEIEAQNKHA